MSVYFIADGRGHIKIGRSANPKARMADLQTATALKLQMLGCIPGDADVERRLHSILAESRAVGEWFRVSDPFVRLGMHLCGHQWNDESDFEDVYAEWLEQEALDEKYRRLLYDQNDWSDSVQAA